MQAADKQKFLEFYKKAHDPFQRYCAAKCYGVIDAADLAGETILIALENFSSLRKPEAFLAYLFGIANNIIKTKLRQKKFTAKFDEKAFQNICSQEINPETRHDIDVLYHALYQLPDRQKEALILFEISGYSIKEIMQIQNCKESAVKQRLKRGRAKLSEIMGIKQLKSESVKKPSKILFSIFL